MDGRPAPTTATADAAHELKRLFRGEPLGHVRSAMLISPHIESNLPNDVDILKPRSSFRRQAGEVGSDKETDDACDGVGKGNQ